MMNVHAAWLLVAVLTGLQATTEEPEAWKRYRTAAAEALNARDFAKAEALLKQIVHEAKELGDNDARQVAPLEALAAFYLSDACKRCAEADPLLRRALAVVEKAKGADDPDVADTLLKLAICRLKIDDDNGEEAEHLQQRALAIVEKAHGKDDLSVASVLHDLAVGHFARGQVDKAEAELLRAVAIREKRLGPDNAELADLFDELGKLHYMSRFTAILETVSKLPPTLDQRNASEVLAVLDRLPKRDELKKLAERHGRQAQAFCERALAIREKALEPNDPKIRDSLRTLTGFALESDHLADAERYLARWLELHEQTKEAPSENFVELLMLRGWTARRRGDWTDAQRRYAACQAAVEQVHGAESKDAAELLVSRADVAIEGGQFADAERFLKRSLDLQALWMRQDDSLREARGLMQGTYQDHEADRTAYRLWNQLSDLSARRVKTDFPTVRVHDEGAGGLAEILDLYAKLLRRSNRVLPPPTEVDLAYLKKSKFIYSDTNLEHLFNIRELLDYDPLDDAGLSHIARLYSLEHLDLGGPQITDVGLVHLKSLGSLHALSLRGTQITDTGLAQIAGLTELEKLNLDRTRVSDAGLVHLKGMTKLAELTLNNTNITDAGLEQLKAMTGVRRVTMCFTKATPAAVERLRRSRPDLVIEHSEGAGFPGLNDPRSGRRSPLAVELFPLPPLLQDLPAPSTAAKPAAR